MKVLLKYNMHIYIYIHIHVYSPNNDLPHFHKLAVLIMSQAMTHDVRNRMLMLDALYVILNIILIKERIKSMKSDMFVFLFTQKTLKKEIRNRREKVTLDKVNTRMEH